MTRTTTPRALALVLLISMAAAACGGTATAVVETVDPVAAAAILDSDPTAVVLDIRTPEEFAEGHIAGSVNIDFYAADFADQLAALDRDANYVMYCRSGNRSGQAMETFRDLGFLEVHEVDGGIVNWLESGLPTNAG